MATKKSASKKPASKAASTRTRAKKQPVNPPEPAPPIRRELGGILFFFLAVFTGVSYFNINGNIEGKITVNVLDDEGDCPLYVTNIYGGSNLTDYEPTDVTLVSPVVNLVHAKYGISGNVYGGSKGNVNATPPTKVTANPLVNIGYDASSMSITFPSDYPATNTLTNFPRAIVAGSVFGGGDAAKVVGNTAIFLRNRAKVFGNVYGGGNMGEVSGDTKVIVNGQNQ